MSDIWYYAEGETTVGPFSQTELIGILAQVPGARNVLVWRDGIVNWQKASEFPDLLPYVIKPPPVPVPPPLPTKNATAVEPTIHADDRVRFQYAGKIAAEPDVIGGWLILVAFGQVVGPLRLLASLFSYYESFDANIWVDYPLTAYGEAILNVSIVLVSICTTVLFFKRSRLFPSFFIWECVLSVLFLPIDTLLLLPVVHSLDKAIAALSSQEISQWIVAVISSTIWIPYVKASQRVRRTFIN
jgi:hypothetical protein